MRRLATGLLGAICLLCFGAGAAFLPKSPVRAEELSGGCVRYEAENATSFTGCKKDTKTDGGRLDGASGKAILNDVQTSAKIDFTVTVPEAGKYFLTVGYCTASTAGNISITATTKENNTYPIHLARTCTDWKGYLATCVEVELSAGEQIISLGSVTVNLALRLDYIELEKINFSKYEAESAEVTDCEKDGLVVSEERAKSFPNASGKAGVKNIDFSTSRVNFNVNVSEAGKYKITVGYCATSAASLIVTTAENFTYVVNCARTCNDWYGYFKTTAEISLSAGEQVLSVRRGSGYVRLDYIGLEKTGAYEAQPSDVPEGYTRYEAEDLIRTQGSLGFNEAASGNLFIGGTNLEECLTLNLPVEKESLYEFKIGYSLAAGESATLDVRLNGKTAASPTLNGGKGEAVFGNDVTAAVRLLLPLGENTVEIVRQAAGPRFDFVDVKELKDLKLAKPVMTVGAAVRMKADFASSGLRFETKYSQKEIDNLTTAENVEGIAYGTLIVPLDYLNDGTECTFEALKAANKDYLDVVSTGFLNDGQAPHYYGSIINVKPENYTRKFIGLGYVKLTLKGGTEMYIYADYDKNNARSVAEVANDAYTDRSGEQNEEYKYQTADGDYSPYTEAQLIILKEYTGTAEAVS